MSEQKAVVMDHARNCAAWKDRNGHDVNGEDCTCGVRFRIEISTLRTLKDAWEKRAYEAENSIATLTAERDSAKRELAEIQADAKAERKKYEVLEAENAALKKALSKPWEHSEHWRNPETGHIECECCCKWALDMESLKKENAALKAQVERLSAPVSDAEGAQYGHFAELSGAPCVVVRLKDIDALIASRTTPPAKEPK